MKKRKSMITCFFEDGDKAYLRHVVMDGILIREGSILLVKRAAHLSEGGKYGLPGGYLDRDESVQEGILREIKEETGWDARIIQFLGIVDALSRGDNRQSVTFVFHMEPLEQTGEPDHETAKMKWFPLEALPPSEQIAFDHERIIRAFIETAWHGKPFPQFLSEEKEDKSP